MITTTRGKDKTRRLLKALPTFQDRLQERRRLGQDIEVIARYALEVVEGSQNPKCRSNFKVDEANLLLILNADEMAAYQRFKAARWAHRQRKKIRENASERNRKQATVAASRNAAFLAQKYQQEAELRKHLQAQGAVTIGEVSRRLDVSVYKVRKLQATGDLPSAGFVPVQHSFGKPVHLWLPETILLYLNKTRR